MGRLGAASIAASILCVASSARADPPAESATTSDRTALAQALFEKGKAAMADHRYDEACPALAESFRLDAGGGTELALGLCHEQEGRTATAWAELKDALARAREDGEAERETVARQHSDALALHLSTLIIRLDADTAQAVGLVVMRDGIALGRPAWDMAAPVNPGEHDVAVSAPGKQPWSTRVRVGPEGDEVEVAVPSLGEPPAAPRAKTATPKPPEARRGLAPTTIAGISLAGVSAVSLGIGIGFGVDAIGKQALANAVCPTSACNDPAALRANATARSSAWVADVAVPLGVAAGISSIVLFAVPTAPRPRRAEGAWSVRLSASYGVFAAARRTF